MKQEHRPPYNQTVYPVVIDTTEVFDEILERLHGGRDPTLSRGAHSGTTRLFAAPNVLQEVPEVIIAKFARRGVDPNLGTQLWETDYRPHLFVVDTTGINFESSALSRLSREDSTDVPTARLSLLLSPVISLSADNDLIRHGFAINRRWVVTHHAASVTHGRAALFAFGIPVQLGSTGIGSVLKAAGKHGVRGYLLLSAEIAGLYWAVRQLSQRLDSLKLEKWLKGVGKFAEFILEAHMRGEQASETLKAIALTPHGHQDKLITELAQHLGHSDEPLTATTLSQLTWGPGIPVPRSHFQAVKSRLEELPAFVRVGPHRWQCGYQVS